MKINPLAGKAVVVGLLALMLLIPLSMVHGLISERAGREQEVITQISQSAAAQQHITLPVIVVPVTRTWIEKVETTNSAGKLVVTQNERKSQHYLPLMPEVLKAESEAKIDFKYRSLYRVLTYNTPVRITGRFTWGDLLRESGLTDKLEIGAPVLVIGVSDARGIVNQPMLDWNVSGRAAQRLKFEPGTGEHSQIKNGISIKLDRDFLSRAGTAEFATVLDVNGMERLSFNPTGGETQVNMSAPWQHPSFIGIFSPERTITENGFQASWKTSTLSTNARAHYNTCLNTAKCEWFETNRLGVSLAQPANLYQQLERAAKYGFLIVGMVFAAFFLIETLRSLQLHPIQYGLVGLALAMFFVLLVAASEHIGLMKAYAGAATASVLLIGGYVGAILRSMRSGLGFMLMIGLIYGVLYILLTNEETALVMGSVMLFTLLAVVMGLTRKVNWYQLTQRKAEPETEEGAGQGEDPAQPPTAELAAPAPAPSQG